MEQALKVKWIDGKRKPTCEPNPAYPDGIDLDVSNHATRACSTALPYPAKRIGAYVVECQRCGSRVTCTTAGRVDDPRSIKIACKAN